MKNAKSETQKRKTVDEMFQEMGFQRRDEHINGAVQYFDPEYGDTITVLSGKVEFSDTEGNYCFTVGSMQIRAIYHLLKEIDFTPIPLEEINIIPF